MPTVISHKANNFL